MNFLKRQECAINPNMNKIWTNYVQIYKTISFKLWNCNKNE